MRIGRWFRHFFASTHQVRRALPPAAMERIRAAILQSEAGHSGEIRFAVEAALPWSYVKRDAPARQRATMVFSKLRVWDTERNNGVLLYVELADRAIEIVADRGIARHVKREEWERVCAAVREHLSTGNFEAGVIAGIEAIGRLLQRHFPEDAGPHVHELSDRPVVL
jgi:uncharacterized membrane protein